MERNVLVMSYSNGDFYVEDKEPEWIIKSWEPDHPTILDIHHIPCNAIVHPYNNEAIYRRCTVCNKEVPSFVWFQYTLVANKLHYHA